MRHSSKSLTKLQTLTAMKPMHLVRDSSLFSFPCLHSVASEHVQRTKVAALTNAAASGLGAVSDCAKKQRHPKASYNLNPKP